MMNATILDGKKIASDCVARVRERIEQRAREGVRRPGLAVVLVGDDEASRVYVRNKRQCCEHAGIISQAFDLPSTVTENVLYQLIERLNEDATVDGILVQLPLPPHVDTNRITNAIRPDKDVDGFHAQNIGRLALRQPGIRPCTPKGIMTMLESVGVPSKRQHCVVVGASNHVGRPMMLEMLLAGATVTCCHKFTPNLESYVAQADILVVAVGKPGLILGRWIKPGAVVIDVGMNRQPDGRLCGDVEFEEAARRASWITPVPGGVGPMTVATLMENTLLAAEAREL